MAIFKRGYEASREEKERQDRQREQSFKKLFNFFLTGDGDEAEIIFLTPEPINYEEYNLKTTVGGKERFEKYTCMGDNDALSDRGLKTSFQAAYLIVDRREYSYKKDGKTVNGKDQVKLFTCGMKVVSQLDRINSRYKGLLGKVLNMVRLGTGTSTTYTVEKTDDRVNLSSQQITNLLPESIRDMYDGTLDSLYAIVEDQLAMRAYDYDAGEEVDNGSTSVNDDDDDDDNNSGIITISGDDDDEEEVVKPKLGNKKKSLFKKPQSSLKKSSTSTPSSRKRLLKS